jgi:hypothetical protein
VTMRGATNRGCAAKCDTPAEMGHAAARVDRRGTAEMRSAHAMVGDLSLCRERNQQSR